MCKQILTIQSFCVWCTGLDLNFHIGIPFISPFSRYLTYERHHMPEYPPDKYVYSPVLLHLSLLDLDLFLQILSFSPARLYYKAFQRVSFFFYPTFSSLKAITNSYLWLCAITISRQRKNYQNSHMIKYDCHQF
jgi:hypothetical protein